MSRCSFTVHFHAFCTLKSKAMYHHCGPLGNCMLMTVKPLSVFCRMDHCRQPTMSTACNSTRAYLNSHLLSYETIVIFFITHNRTKFLDWVNLSLYNFILLSNGLLTPYSNGNITFIIASSEPVRRPGYNSFNSDPALLDFATASSIRIRMQDHYYVTNARHRYYALYELTVSGRCDCHGHADECDVSVRPYTCQCLPDSFTQGPKCSECQSLYNDKPFRRGDVTNRFACKFCECYGHANSCYYDAMLDSFPDDHDVGGGGVCVDCQHNTTGRMCHTCLDFFYRPTGKSLYALDVCEDCNCSLAGVNDATKPCEKVITRRTSTYNCILLQYTDGQK